MKWAPRPNLESYTGYMLKSSYSQVHDQTIQVTQCGRICINSRKVNLNTVFAGQYVGKREVADEIWVAGRPYPSFMDYDLGFIDQDENKVESVGVNPFTPKVLPMS